MYKIVEPPDNCTVISTEQLNRVVMYQEKNNERNCEICVFWPQIKCLLIIFSQKAPTFYHICLDEISTKKTGYIYITKNNSNKARKRSKKKKILKKNPKVPRNIAVILKSKKKSRTILF